MPICEKRGYLDALPTKEFLSLEWMPGNRIAAMCSVARCSFRWNLNLSLSWCFPLLVLDITESVCLLNKEALLMHTRTPLSGLTGIIRVGQLPPSLSSTIMSMTS